MLESRYSLLLLPLMLIAGRLSAMDDPIESFLNKTSLTHQALIKATQQGSVPTVMQLIHRNPAIIDSRDKYGNTLLIIAALHCREELVKRLAQAGARINWLEYTQIWGKLSQTPQGAAAKRILSFLDFIRSEEFLLYHQRRLQPPSDATQASAAHLPKIINRMLSCLRGTLFYPSEAQQPFAEHGAVTVPHAAHAEYTNPSPEVQLVTCPTRLYAATFDNNHTGVKQMLETSPIMHIKNMILSCAASIATRECNNQFLALYILFSRDGVLKDIFFTQLMDAQAHN